MAHAKRGRKPKGQRAPISLRIPQSHRDALDAAADEAGYNRMDYCALLIARHLGLPDPEYIHGPNLNQTELPLQRTA